MGSISLNKTVIWRHLNWLITPLANRVKTLSQLSESCWTSQHIVISVLVTGIIYQGTVTHKKSIFNFQVKRKHQIRRIPLHKLWNIYSSVLLLPFSF